MRIVFLVLLSAGIVLAGWFTTGVFVRGQGRDEVEIPKDCVDINGDGGTDISDAVYLLEWLFRGGPEPKRCVAQAPACDLTDAECERLKEDLAFARRVAGGFFGRGEVGVLEPFNIIASFTSDGNAVFDTALQFGAAGGPAASKSTFRGSWTRTGERELGVTILQFDYDADGVNNAIVKTSFTVEVDEAFEEFAAEGTTAVFSPDRDPLEDEPDIVRSVSSSFVIRRIPPLR